MRLVVLLWLFAAAPAAADCLDTATNDCDGDGITTAEGDCDDEDPDVGQCEGDPLADATIVGGDSCSGSAAWLVLLPVFGLGRRKEA